MKLETVEKELQNWGELIVTTSAGESYELHLGDTKFDMAKRMIMLSTPTGDYLIDGDSVEDIKKHYGHKLGDKH